MVSLKPVRIRLRYVELDAFVEKFASNVTRGGVFLATRQPRPEGTEVAFEIQLATGQIVLAGQGTVSWVREWNPAEPTRPYGMGVRFISVEPSTRPILARLLKIREAGGSGPAARRLTAPLPILAHDGKSGPNGRALPAVDTATDLASELGVDPGLVRSLIDRTWMTNARAEEDLSELMRPDPIEPVSLSQALADLPRFLELPSGRRRTSSAFRTLDSVALKSAGATEAASAPETSGVPVVRDDEITDMTLASAPHAAGQPAVASPPFPEASSKIHN